MILLGISTLFTGPIRLVNQKKTKKKLPFLKVHLLLYVHEFYFKLK
jgi:hypothetical protein